jgi:WhiB family transcriptional regulator, redox-sensing transcriptional regulator
VTNWWIGWQHRAACRGEQELFFPDDPFEARPARLEREARAKAICATCEVREDCLEYALRARETHGIWGGRNEYERRSLLRERGSLGRAAG